MLDVTVSTRRCVVRSLGGHEAMVVSLLAHPHLPLLVSASGNSIRVWDLETRSCLRTLAGHTHFVYGLALDRTGRSLASGSGDRSVKLWDLDSGACFRTLEDDGMRYIFAVAWDWSGALVASGSDNNRVRVWDATSGALRHTLVEHSGPVRARAAHP